MSTRTETEFLEEENSKLRAELRELTETHEQLLEEILRNADEDINGGDEAAEYLAEQYVRFLERERDDLREQLAAAVNPTAEDYDSAAEILRLRDQLAGVRERLENLAAGLEMSARTSQPSKKSEIERGCAEAVRGIAAEAGVKP